MVNAFVGEFVDDKEKPEQSTPPLRAPELIVAYQDWDQKIDVWSYGLIVRAFECTLSNVR